MPSLPPELPGRLHFLRDWWSEVTGQSSSWLEAPSTDRWKLRRVLLWLPVITLGALLAVGVGIHALTGWRAHLLADKARGSLREGGARMAMIQVESAAKLRPSDPEIQRLRASVLAANGDPRCLEVWDALAERGLLAAEDRAERAAAAMRLGNDEQFESVARAVAAADGASAAELWRGRRAAWRREFAKAEAHLRTAAEAGQSDAALELARLLAASGNEGALAEAAGLVDSLCEGEKSAEALAFALQALPSGPATRLAWATRAYAVMRPDNVALLPAAAEMVAGGHRSLEQVASELRPVYAVASPDERAAHAGWLLEHNLAAEVLDSIKHGEAKTSPVLFRARAEALASEGAWTDLLALMDAGSPLEEPASLLLRARAERALGRVGAASASSRRAIIASAPALQLPEVLGQVDETGQEDLADRVLLELCEGFSTADLALRVARWRFSQRGQPRLRDEAFQRARQAAPRSEVVADMERLAILLTGGTVSSSETAASCAKDTANLDFRLTHALALLGEGKTAEARLTVQAFEEAGPNLTPPQKAVLAAVLAASGSTERARGLARSINSAALSDAEYRLVYGQLAPVPAR